MRADFFELKNNRNIDKQNLVAVRWRGISAGRNGSGQPHRIRYSWLQSYRAALETKSRANRKRKILSGRMCSSGYGVVVKPSLISQFSIKKKCISRSISQTQSTCKICAAGVLVDSRTLNSLKLKKGCFALNRHSIADVCDIHSWNNCKIVNGK